MCRDMTKSYPHPLESLPNRLLVFEIGMRGVLLSLTYGG
jgi:hypothetical protein